MTNNRNELMKLMNETDDFFSEYGLLDDKVYGEGAISKKHKELFLLAISIVQKCEECIDYHLDECIRQGAVKDEIIESIKMGMMSGGTTSYPYIRKIFALLNEKKIIGKT
jgi:AhpD family alkylhydroperoxidase